MGWLRRGKEKKRGAPAPDEVRGALAELRGRIAQNMVEGQWGAVTDDVALALQLLRDTSGIVPVTHSLLAELYSHWSLAINGQRRYEEAFAMLQSAEQLWNMEAPQAVAWAKEQGITLQGEGEEPDLNLILAVLTALSENAARFDSADAGRVLREMIGVADLARREQEGWLARTRLAAWTAEQQAWPTLLALAADMATIARRSRDLNRLLDAMRQFSEAYIGVGQMERALEAQRLVVDVARALDHPSLEREQGELRTLLDAQG